MQVTLNISPIFIFSIYSIELELHDMKVCFAHLCRCDASNSKLLSGAMLEACG
jgi:hypothetical protein